MPGGRVARRFTFNAFICFKADVGLRILPMHGAEFGDLFASPSFRRFTEAGKVFARQKEFFSLGPHFYLIVRMSCGVELCPTGTVGGIAMPEAAPAVIMQGGAYYAHSKKMGGARFFANPSTAVEPYGCDLATFGREASVGQKGGACACNSRMYGGSRGCSTCLNSMLGSFKSRKMGGSRFSTKHGGYRATKKDKDALKRFRAGKSIGFTMAASLKAKGLINRANGTRRISAKYQGGNRTNK